MTHLAFRRDIAAHLLHLPNSLRSSRGHFLHSSTQGRCTVCKKLQKSLFSVANGFTR
ncbi:hypothetical protein T06_1941 [Trichinella sp. T6]|nr:hypothetical protein T06_1941 [Trichinella sp. T6]